MTTYNGAVVVLPRSVGVALGLLAVRSVSGFVVEPTVVRGFSGSVGVLRSVSAYIGNSLAVMRFGGGSGGADVPLSLPAGWLAVALPDAGYIGPVMAQLALVRGAAAVFAGGALSIGGAVLVGPAGKVFNFSAAGSADYWVAINRARGVREVELLAGLDAAGAAVWLEKKRAALAVVAVSVVNAAARCNHQGIAAALVAESSWCLSKWGA